MRIFRIPSTTHLLGGELYILRREYETMRQLGVHLCICLDPPHLIPGVCCAKAVKPFFIHKIWLWHSITQVLYWNVTNGTGILNFVPVRKFYQIAMQYACRVFIYKGM